MQPIAFRSFGRSYCGVLATGLALAVCGLAEAVTWFVDDSVPTTGSGASWSSPFKTIQEAFDEAVAGDEIHVGQGEYRADFTPPIDDKNLSFSLKSLVSIQGGYAGFEAGTPGARDVVLYETILTGDLADNDGPDFTNYSDNSYHVIKVTTAVSPPDPSGTPAPEDKANLDGFTIKGGNAVVRSLSLDTWHLTPELSSSPVADYEKEIGKVDNAVAVGIGGVIADHRPPAVNNVQQVQYVDRAIAIHIAGLIGNGREDDGGPAAVAGHCVADDLARVIDFLGVADIELNLGGNQIIERGHNTIAPDECLWIRDAVSTLAVADDL